MQVHVIYSRDISSIARTLIIIEKEPPVSNKSINWQDWISYNTMLLSHSSPSNRVALSWKRNYNMFVWTSMIIRCVKSQIITIYIYQYVILPVSVSNRHKNISENLQINDMGGAVNSRTWRDLPILCCYIRFESKKCQYVFVFTYYKTLTLLSGCMFHCCCDV